MNRDFYGNWKNNFSGKSGMSSFLNNLDLSKVVSGIGSMINPLLGAGLNIGINALGSKFTNDVVNSSLTGKEREQNAWNAQQAQLNRDFQEEMSNTAYQRGVADMQSAGLNPALMYGSGSAASTPTGSNAQGSAGMVSPMDVFQIALQSKLLDSEIGLKKSQTDLNKAKADESKVSAAQIVEMTENIKVERQRLVSAVENLDLDNQEKRIILAYADEREKGKLDNLKMDVDTKRAQVDKFNAEVDKLSEETKKVVQETINLQEQVDLMMSQESLNYAQASQCASMCKQIDQNVEILKKDNSHYDWNHMKTLSFKDGVAVVSDSNGAYAGSFTGPSAAMRSNAQRRSERKEERAKNRIDKSVHYGSHPGGTYYR